MGNVTSAVTYNPAEDLDELHPAFVTFCVVLQSILCVVGGLGNLLTILAIVLCKSLHKTHNVYILHLAVVDTIINIFLIPINIDGLLNSIEDPPQCIIIGAIAFSALVVSILSLMMISINRYVLICKDTSTYIKLYNKKTVALSIIAMWVWAVVLVVPMSAFDGLGWSQKTHYCFFQNYNFAAYLYMNFGLCQLGVVAPSVTTSICYMLIIRKLKASAEKMAVHPTTMTTATTNISAIPTTVNMSC